MDTLDKEKMAYLVKNYPISDVLDLLQETIENQINDLVDLNIGHADIVKDMSVVAHHLSLFPRT